MSQNKTIIPDFDYESLGSQRSSDTYSDLYSPSFSQGVADRTYVGNAPGGGMEPVMTSQPLSNTGDSEHKIILQERVVAGVLFSISKGLLGEIFPLYLGRNLVGYTPECDIKLTERTVSPIHALIQVYKDFETGTYDVSVTDYGSSHGTTVNGERGDFGSLPLKENDVIAIGSHYRFIMKLFNAEGAGLYEDPEFDSNLGGQEGSQVSSMSNDFYAPSRGTDSNRTVIY